MKPAVSQPLINPSNETTAFALNRRLVSLPEGIMSHLYRSRGNSAISRVPCYHIICPDATNRSAAYLLHHHTLNCSEDKDLAHPTTPEPTPISSAPPTYRRPKSYVTPLFA